MPKIGDIIRGTEINRYRGKLIWAACIDCDKERWVQLVKGNPESIRCIRCSNIGKLNPNWKGGLATNNKKEWNRRYNINNPEKIKRVRLKCNYNLSYEDWLKMWENQDGKCGICGKPFIRQSDAYTDHNHKTNEIRGLLCRQCNFGIGNFNDNPKLMMKAIKYLTHQMKMKKKKGGK